MTAHRRRWMLAAVAATAAGAAAAQADTDALAARLDAAERAFARSMAERDLDAFSRHVADDAVFLNNGKPLRGKAAIVEAWRRFFAPGPAPFAWVPDAVVVLPSGRLGQTVGPVSAPDGKVFARFNSTWRLDDDGQWRVVLDHGSDVCR